LGRHATRLVLAGDLDISGAEKLALPLAVLAGSPFWSAAPAPGKTHPAIAIAKIRHDQAAIGRHRRGTRGGAQRQDRGGADCHRSTRYLSWRACHALNTQSPSADELAIQAKICGSETAVRVITDLMRVVGIDSYNHEAPFGRLLQDALALPIFDGGQGHKAAPASHDAHAAGV
jgi:hypothetical protein